MWMWMWPVDVALPVHEKMTAQLAGPVLPLARYAAAFAGRRLKKRPGPSREGFATPFQATAGHLKSGLFATFLIAAGAGFIWAGSPFGL
jgi:hypothetical protein